MCDITQTLPGSTERSLTSAEWSLQLERGIAVDKAEWRRAVAEKGTTEELLLLPEQEHRVGLSRRVFCRAAQFRILSPEQLGRTEGECTT